MNDRVFPRPDRRLVLLEGPRALGEMASLMAAAPVLATAPRGDGHPVLVLPGFAATDVSTTLLRGYLSSLGYRVLPWQLGRNLGPRMPDLMHQLTDRLDSAFEAAGGRSVSLVGWSLGGVYARILAHLDPQRVRQVVTLGSPFAGDPRSTAVYSAVREVGGETYDLARRGKLRVLASEPLPGVPSSAIFSKTDGVVPWQIAVRSPSDNAENIEVFASHIGLGVTPTVLYAVADRLSNPENEWRPFERTGWRRLAYGEADLTEDEALAASHQPGASGAA